MELQTVLAARRSVREFTDRIPSQGEIEQILKAGILAPSACNMQSWYFYVIADSKKRELLKEVCAPWVSLAPVVIIVCTDDNGIVSRFGERGRKFPMQDTSLAMENMLLKAVDLGLGGCIIGAYKQEKITELFNIPSEHTVVALLPIGEPKSKIPARDRKPLHEVSQFIGALPSNSSKMSDERNEAIEIKNANACGSKFENCDMSNSVLRNMSMCNTKFENLDLNGCAFTDANMRNTSYIHLNMDDSHLHTMSALRARIGGCEECEKKGIQCVNLSESTWDNVKLVNVKMNHCNFEGSLLTDIKGCNSKLYDIDLDSAELSGVNMVKSKVKCANLFGSEITGSNFTNVSLNCCDIDGMTIDGINVKEAIEAFKKQ